MHNVCHEFSLIACEFSGRNSVPDGAVRDISDRHRHFAVGDEWNKLYGYGLEFAVDETGNLLFAEREGINAGASAVIHHYPDQDITVALLANTRLGV